MGNVGGPDLPQTQAEQILLPPLGAVFFYKPTFLSRVIVLRVDT